MASVVVNLQFAPRKGAERVAVERAELAVDQGIAGDANGGPGDRQIVLMDLGAHEAVRSASEHARGLCFSRFRDNIRVSGLGALMLSAGHRVRIGTALVEVSGARKRCFAGCRLVPARCDLHSGVVFCRVIRPGMVKLGDDVQREAV